MSGDALASIARAVPWNAVRQHISVREFRCLTASIALRLLTPDPSHLPLVQHEPAHSNILCLYSQNYILSEARAIIMRSVTSRSICARVNERASSNHVKSTSSTCPFQTPRPSQSLPLLYCTHSYRYLQGPSPAIIPHRTQIRY